MNTNNDDGERIDDIAGGGSINCGEDVRFDFRTGKGEIIKFHIGYGSLSRLVTCLQTFGQMALNDRAKRPHGTRLTDLVHPFRLKSLPRFGWTDNAQNLTIQFPTKEGIPLLLSMTADQAQAVHEALGDHLSSPSSSSGVPH